MRRESIHRPTRGLSSRAQPSSRLSTNRQADGSQFVTKRLSTNHYPLTTAVSLALLFVLLTACKTNTDAAAAAQQLTTVSTNLSAYYADLSTQLDDTITLNEVQAAMYQLPFGDDVRGQILDVKSQIAKREAMAQSLGKLATAYGSLAGSTAGADAGTAASALADELSTAQAIPSGSAIPDIVGQAAKLLVDFVQTRDLKKGSIAVSKAVSAVNDLFDGEKPAYESIEKQRLALARQIANKLIDNHGIEIDFATLVQPATKPFTLTPKSRDIGDDPAYLKLVKSEVNAQAEEQQRQYADSTNDLSAALQAVRKAVDHVAKGK